MTLYSATHMHTQTRTSIRAREHARRHAYTSVHTHQGAYLPLPMSLLFLIWRVDSIRVAIERRCVMCACGARAHTYPLPPSPHMDTQTHHLPLCACNRTFRDWKETLGLAAHYAFLLTFVSPLTLLGACLISGFMTATITTVTHQSEELFFDEEPEFVDAQYRSTRDAVCPPGFTHTQTLSIRHSYF